jgi:hypothetical protein
MKKQWGILLMFMIMYSAVYAQKSGSTKVEGPVKDLCVKRVKPEKDSTTTGLEKESHLGAGSINHAVTYDFEAELQTNLDTKNIYYKDTSTGNVEEVKERKMLQRPFRNKRGERDGLNSRERNEGQRKAERDVRSEDEECI